MDQLQQNQVVFENTADQYVKGENVTAFFIIANGIEDVSNEDRIGLLRVGCTSIKQCVAYAPVKFYTYRSMRRGTAIFSPSSFSVTDDEFYQFCYINKTTKNLGTSVPFQLNCSLDDIDFLSNASRSKTNSVASSDDYDDIVVINSTESQKKPLSLPFKTPSSEPEETRLRSQLAVTMQFAQDQATQIVDLERRLMQANEITLKSQERQLALEQQLRDLELTSEKHQRSFQGQLDHSSKASNQRQACLEQQLRDLQLTSEKYQRSMQGQLDAYSKQASVPDEQAYVNLKNSLKEIEKRCVKYQKSEAELKRQVNTYQNLHNDLQNEIRYLTVRLSISAEEYQTLAEKYKELERKTERTETKSSQETTGRRSSFYWQQ